MVELDDAASSCARLAARLRVARTGTRMDDLMPALERCVSDW